MTITSLYFISPTKLLSLPPTLSQPPKPLPCLRCNCSRITAEPRPLFASVTSFAPATISNLGPGFDIFGCAVDGIGDRVTVTVDSAVRPGDISISDICGPQANSELSKNPLWNCAGIAAIAVMKMLSVRKVGLSIQVEKGVPLGSGLGSSAASAAAAAVAVDELFGARLTREQLALAGLESEAKLSGYHADSIAAAILGGFAMIKSYEPLELKRLFFPSGKDVFFVLVSPEFEAPTEKIRPPWPAKISTTQYGWTCRKMSAFAVAVLEGDMKWLGEGLSCDKIVELKRTPLIPGIEGVKKAAMEGGALGSSISGAGPTVVAIVEDEEKGVEVGERMVEAFRRAGNLRAKAVVKKLDRTGARIIGSRPR